MPVGSPHCSTKMLSVVSRWQEVPSKYFASARCRKLLVVHGALSAAMSMTMSPWSVFRVAVNGLR